MSSPKPPKAPDYAALAAQQGQENRDTAIYNNAINRVNQVGPDGSITWSIRPGADPKNPKPGDYIQTTSLSPEQQALATGQNQLSQSYLDTAKAGMGRVSDAMGQPFDTSGLPGLRTVDSNGMPVGSVDLQGKLGSDGLPALDYGTSDSRARVEQALLSRINPQIQQDRADTETRLLNSGIEKGSDAWNREMTRLDQQANDARMGAVTAGGAEESRLAGLQMGQRSQLFGEQGARATAALNEGTFANQSARDSVLAALSAAEQGNKARSQGFTEASYLRSLPLNETNALRTGSQVSSPNFQGYYTGGNAAAAPIMDGGIAQGNYNTNAYQQQMAGYNALLGGLANLGVGWMGM